MQSSWRLGVVVAALAFACSGGDHASMTGGLAGTPAASAPGVGGEDAASTAGATVGGSPGEAGRTGAAGEGTPGGASEGGAESGGAAVGGNAGVGDGGEPIVVEPLPDPTCVGSGKLSGATLLPISTASADRFGSITPDEQVIVWTVAEGIAVTLHYAQRASLSDEFSTAGTLELEDAADDAVTISADGLRIVYVNADRKGFTQLVRASRDEPFADVDNRDFEPIAESSQDFAEDEQVGDPVLGPDDSTFIYSRYGAQRSATLFGTLRFSRFAPWPAGTEMPVSPGLEAVDGVRLRPTGLSLDGQTLFLWNGATATQAVAMLSHETSQYDIAFELENARGAAPNAACSRVYFERDGDLWTAEFQ